VWSYTTGSQVRSSPAVADGVVFIGSQDYRVYAFGVSQRVVVPLDIEVDVGSIHFRGEIAEFYVLTTLDGYAVDSTIARALLYYSNGTVKTTLHALVTRIAPGLYRIPYTIPADAPEGTYTLVVKALYITNVIVAHGVSFKSFQLSPTLTRWNAWLIEIKDGVATIQTDITTIKTNLNTINATISEIQGNIAAIETDIGTIKTDVNTINSKIITINGTLVTINSTIGSIQQDISTINGKIAAINGTLVTIETDIGTIKTDIDDIQLKVVAINGDIATIQTTLGTINGTITSIQGDIATIQTDIGAIKTILEEWTGGVTGSIITPEGTFRILVLTTSALEGPIAFSDNVVAITVSGPSGTPGTTNIVIPKQLLVGIESSINDIFVTLDDEQVVFTYTEHPKTYVLQITYTHSTHVIKVYLTGPPPAPFPAWTIALIVLIAAVATSVTFYTLKTRKPQVAKTK
jgi:prefoldin subunit 5